MKYHLKKISAVSILTLLCGLTHATGTTNRAPVFADFPAKDIYRGTNHPVNLKSHPNAHEFRTRLREASHDKPSFAGHYIVAEWGCGSPCQQVALIDAKTGTVYFAPFATSLGNQHQLNSRLLIADAPEDIVIYYEGKVPKNPMFHTIYYVWDESKHEFSPLK